MVRAAKKLALGVLNIEMAFPIEQRQGNQAKGFSPIMPFGLWHVAIRIRDRSSVSSVGGEKLTGHLAFGERAFFDPNPDDYSLVWAFSLGWRA